MPNLISIKQFIKIALTVSVTMNLAYTYNEVKETFIDERENHYHMEFVLKTESGDELTFSTNDSTLSVETKGGKRWIIWPVWSVTK